MKKCLKNKTRYDLNPIKLAKIKSLEMPSVGENVVVVTHIFLQVMQTGMITLESNLTIASKTDGEYTLQCSNSASRQLRETHTLVQRDCSIVGSGKNLCIYKRRDH